MRLLFSTLFLAQIALAQTMAVPCIQPTPPPVARAGQAPANGPGRANFTPRAQTPQSAADIAEIAKLRDVPPWTSAAIDGDYSAGPGYPTAPELAKRVGVPEGKVFEFVMNSGDSKFYPGLNGAFQRHVCVYIPAEYVPGTVAPVIVAADAYGMRYNLPTILDNMIYDQRLPVMVAVMIDNGGSERSMEYDTVSDKYVKFVEEEVLPRAEKEASVKLSSDPEARMTLGGSSGGAVALTMAWFRPDLYHRVLTYSGTFVNLRNGPDAPLGAV